MKQHKTIWIILLLAALLLGASVLYTQLAPSSGALAPTSAPESDSATPEPIAAPDFTAYDLDGNRTTVRFCRFPDCAELLGQLVRSLQERNGRLPESL